MTDFFLDFSPFQLGLFVAICSFSFVFLSIFLVNRIGDLIGKKSD